MAISTLMLAFMALLASACVANSDPINPRLRGADVLQSILNGTVNVTYDEGASENRRLAEPSYSGYVDQGMNKCQTTKGKDPKYEYVPGVKTGHDCKQHCDSKCNCFGFSMSVHSNCLLWLEEDIKGGGDFWGFAHCHLKEAFVPVKTKTASAFESAVEDKSAGAAAVKARITSNWDAITNAVAEAGILCEKEFAMFIANVMQESAELTAKTESTSHYTDASYDWGECSDGVSVPVKGEVLKTTDKCTKQYFGRGYLMTTWHKNYKAAKDAGKCTLDSAGNTVDIVTNPEKVATDEKLAWCAAAYFWKKNVHDDRCKNGCDMGNTINAINGDLECHDGNEEAQRRFCFYKSFYESYASTTLYWHDEVCVKDLDAKCPVR